MSLINLPERLPGISALLHYRRESAVPLLQLAETLLHSNFSTLTPGEREVIAGAVSRGNDCSFCAWSHTAAASHHYGSEVMVQGMIDGDAAPPKMRALLAIAERVRTGPQSVGQEQVDAARAAGASDEEIHDAVLIAAAFCMYNRYVEALEPWVPDNPEIYRTMGAAMAERGYMRDRSQGGDVGSEESE